MSMQIAKGAHINAWSINARASIWINTVRTICIPSYEIYPNVLLAIRAFLICKAFSNFLCITSIVLCVAKIFINHPGNLLFDEHMYQPYIECH